MALNAGWPIIGWARTPVAPVGGALRHCEPHELGAPLAIKGFAAAILGGLGNPLGAVLGGLVIGISEALAAVGLSSGYKDVVALGIMLVMMVLLPNGLLGRAGRKGG